MDLNWAAHNLQVIRTLMERSALYRRALAPIMLFLGVLGLAAACLAWFGRIGAPRAFVFWWIGVSVLGLLGSFVMIRRQALKEAEPFWSPPTRRVAQALLPPFSVGFVLALLVIFPRERDLLLVWWLLPLWMALYGCAIHAAGFFMQRGIRLFGWLFVMAGIIGAVYLNRAGGVQPLQWAHAVMGASFGGLHFAYGVYLYFTEDRKNET